MNTRRGFASLLLVGILSVGCLNAADASTHQRKSSKKPQLPPLPSGPQGPVPQVPLDSIPAVAPQVSYRDGQLTIVAPNSTLGDILRAVRKQTAAEMEIPATASERVVTHLGPGPAREVVAELLNGSKFNYVLLGSPSDSSQLTRVVLVAKSGPDNPANGQQADSSQPGNMAPPPPDAPADGQDAEATEDNPDDNNAEQNAVDAEQQPPPQNDQPGIKTPQQMLQEMQQRQLQMQQQLGPGAPPIPGGAYVPQLPQQPPQTPQTPQQQ